MSEARTAANTAARSLVVLAAALTTTTALTATAVAPAHADPGPAGPTTVRASVDRNGGQLQAPSYGQDLSAGFDARPAFTTAGPVWEGDTNGLTDVYFGDSVISSGYPRGMGDGPSRGGAPCVNGRMTAFVSEATNITSTPAPDDRPTVYVRNRAVGKVSRASQSFEGTPFAWAARPEVSDDCMWVSFTAALEGPDGTARQPRVYRYRIYDGTVRLVSEPSARADHSSISHDGRYVAYESGGNVHVRDLETGTLEKASTARDGGPADGRSSGASLSGDGRHVAFDSTASNLTAGDRNGGVNVFVRDLDAGTTRLVRGETRRARTYDAALAADGTHLAYVSAARGKGGAGRVPAVFLRELATGETQLISADVGGGRNDLPARRPSVNDDGSVVAFDSASPDLVTGDTNRLSDVFLRTVKDGQSD
ncbi:TolB family protein [Streptomyces sp. NPDC127108]|uniref:TolB family protein n=1 Tax=Streptomyces sp. NPDC127108 TaxID=3345361 RepID=UPI00362E1B7A